MNFLDMGFWEIILILVVALIIWGPGKLPEIARNLGKYMNTLKKMSFDMTTQVKKELELEEKKSVPPANEPDKKKPSATEKTDDGKVNRKEKTDTD